MSRFDTQDYNLEVLQNNVPKHVMVGIVGHSPALGTTKKVLNPGSIESGDIDQSSLEATPAVVTISSTSANDASGGTGLRTGTVFGLNGSGVLATEAWTEINGTTGTVLSNTFSAVYGNIGATAGSLTFNDGTVWLGTGTITTGVPATKFLSMDPESNKSLSGYYVVPVSKTLFIRQLNISMAAANKDATVFIETSSDGVFWIIQAAFGIESGGPVNTSVIAIPGLPAGTHIRLAGIAAGAGTNVIAIIGCELVDD